MANNKYPNTSYYRPNCEWLLRKLQEAVEILEKPKGLVPVVVKGPYYDLIADTPSTIWGDWNLNEIVETYNNLNNVPRDKALEWAKNTYGRLYAQYTGGHEYEAQLFPAPSILNKIEVATSDTLGGIKADPKTDQDVTPVHIGPDDKLYVAASEYELPQATDTILGGVRAMDRGPKDNQDVTIDPDTGLLYTAESSAGHIVSKTPPEDTELLWVDPDDDTTATFDTELSSTSTNAVQNQAVTKALEGKADKEGNYALIETINITEPTAIIKRTFTAKKIKLVITATASGSSNGSIAIINGNNTFYYGVIADGIRKDYAYYSACEVGIKNNQLNSISGGTRYASNGMPVNTIPWSSFATAATVLDGFRITAAGAQFMPGSKIEVWVVS